MGYQVLWDIKFSMRKFLTASSGLEFHWVVTGRDDFLAGQHLIVCYHMLFVL